MNPLDQTFRVADGSGASNDTRCHKTKRAVEAFHRFLSHVSTRSVLRPRACKLRVSAGGYVPEQPEDTLSFPYLDAAWLADCPTPASKLVLVALADHASAQGECFPSLARLVRRCGLSERAVRDSIRRLEFSKLIETTHKRGTSSSYRLLMTPANAAGESGKCRPSPRRQTPTTPANAAPKPSVDRKTEPKEKGKLFPSEVKESFKAKRELISDSDDSYELSRYRRPDGTIYSRREKMKPEAAARLSQLDKEERKYLSELV